MRMRNDRPRGSEGRKRRRGALMGNGSVAKQRPELCQMIPWRHWWWKAKATHSSVNPKEVLPPLDSPMQRSPISVFLSFSNPAPMKEFPLGYSQTLQHLTLKINHPTPEYYSDTSCSLCSLCSRNTVIGKPTNLLLLIQRVTMVYFESSYSFSGSFSLQIQ